MVLASPAIPPPFLSDEELARSPTIVVAKWENAPLVPHHRVEGNVWKEQEIRTEIVVKGVLKGTLKPGKYTILLGPFLAWESEKGGNVKPTCRPKWSAMNDVKDENLWFLESRRSWDKTDPPHILRWTHTAACNRGCWSRTSLLLQARPLPRVCPSCCVPGTGGRAAHLAVRGRGNPAVALHALRALRRPESGKKPLVAHAAAVASLLGRKEADVRRTAAAVYANWPDAKPFHGCGPC